MEYRLDTNPKYEKPINDLSLILTEHGVPFTHRYLLDGAQLLFPWCKGDVVCHCISIGNDLGMVETYQFPWDADSDDEVSWFPVETAAEKITEFYREYVK